MSSASACLPPARARVSSGGLYVQRVCCLCLEPPALGTCSLLILFAHVGGLLVSAEPSYLTAVLLVPHLQGDLQEKSLEHLRQSDRSSLLSEIQALRAQLRLTHLQNQEKLQQLCTALTSAEARGSRQEHQLRRQGGCPPEVHLVGEVTRRLAKLLLDCSELELVATVTSWFLSAGNVSLVIRIRWLEHFSVHRRLSKNDSETSQRRGFAKSPGRW